ncbi:Mannan endo-1,4-beta-mannosidase [Heracleum sosnowskyi]|uniref:mannan endo-1,4-beta-mannosidase n=1 Tax=Heracleum sosnowskyi TaxID=360622 RepID=A0AAD8H5Q7_9APIA|nr:Mannan endo-1,4-beta-mannosidase [Heracleum sosnowskyi]
MSTRAILFLLILFLFDEHGINLYQVSASNEFIKSRGGHFLLDGGYYYANGFNAYWLMDVASDPSQRDKVSSVFQQAVSNGLTLARTWAFSDGGYQPLQFSPGVYNEQMFQGLDFVIYEARRHGIKLILSLVNNYEDYGGKNQYVNWARDQGEHITSDDDFFSNPVVKGFYKNHINTILTRRNSITGVSYKDDNTIMAWELMNEPRCTSDPSGRTIQAWITEMASYVKSVDKKHLLEIGLEGFYGESAPEDKQFNLNIETGTDFVANNQIPGIDFATIHLYPDQWIPGTDKKSQRSFSEKWIDCHIQDAERILHKPLLVTEFGWRKSGFDKKTKEELLDTVFSDIYLSARRGGVAAGGMFWQLLTEGLDSYRDGYDIVFSESPSIAALISQKSKQLVQIREKYARQSHIKKGDETMNKVEIRKIYSRQRHIRKIMKLCKTNSDNVVKN